jgi:hypothetical protein
MSASAERGPRAVFVRPPHDIFGVAALVSR